MEICVTRFNNQTYLENKKFREKFTNLVENKFELTRKKLKLN